MDDRVTRQQVETYGYNTPEGTGLEARALHEQLNLLCRIGLEIRDLMESQAKRAPEKTNE